MGNAVKSFAKFVAKATISAAGNLVPVVGGPLASYINSKFAQGGLVGGLPEGVGQLQEGQKLKQITTPAQLQALVKQFPDEANKAGLTVDMIKTEVKEAKEQAKAIGGMVKMKMGIPPATQFSKPSKAVGGKIAKGEEESEAKEKKAKRKITKPPTAKQLAARKKFADMVRAKHKKKD